MNGLEFIAAESCLFGIMGSFIVPKKYTEISYWEMYQSEGIFWHKVGMPVERLYNVRLQKSDKSWGEYPKFVCTSF